MGASERRKGLDYERDIARRFRVIFPDCRRNVTESQRGGQGLDLVGAGRLAIQCKRGRQYAPLKRLEDVTAAGPGVMPVLVTKGDGARDIAALYLDDLLAILADVGIVYE